MKQAKTNLMLVARWLIVLTICCLVVPGQAFAKKSAATQPSGCDASCSARCPCCISKAPASPPATPLAPTSSTRTLVAQDLPPVSVLNAFLLRERASEVLVPSDFSAPHFAASIPVFLRHRAILI